jgi:hypothetical protein
LFAHDKLEDQGAFKIERKRVVEPADEDKEDGGDATALDYLEDYKPYNDIPSELDPKKEGARLYSIPNEHIVFDRNILNNGFIKTKKGKWEKFEGSEYFEDAELKGIVVKDGRDYAQMGVQTGKKSKKRDGEIVYINRNNFESGTIQELAKNTEYDVNGLKDAIDAGIFIPMPAETKSAQVLVPVDENKEIEQFYNFRNKSNQMQPDEQGQSGQQIQSDPLGVF